MIRTLSAALLAVALCAPALAQEADQAEASSASDPNRDTVTIGLGGAVIPRYEGSGDYVLSPAGAIRGRVSGIAFSTVGLGLFTDIIPATSATGGKFVLGPIAHLTLNRSSLKRIRDPQIVALGKIKPAVELGGHIGFQQTGLITSDFDNLTIDLAVSHDVTGIHGSTIVTPSINYGTPLSRKVFVGITASATHVGDRYARTYFGVTPAQALASGLPAYSPGAGFKDVSLGAVAAVSITGDLRRGLSLFALGNYARLLGDFGRSPVVRDRTQLLGAVGLGYTF